MKLKTKMIIAVTLSCIAILSGLYGAAITVIMPSYKDIENIQTRNAVNQAVTTINYRLSELHEKVRDYAAWDDTYAFTQNYDQEYVTDNLEMAFDNLRLNLIVITDKSGNHCLLPII